MKVRAWEFPSSTLSRDHKVMLMFLSQLTLMTPFMVPAREAATVTPPLEEQEPQKCSFGICGDRGFIKNDPK